MLGGHPLLNIRRMSPSPFSNRHAHSAEIPTIRTGSPLASPHATISLLQRAHMYSQRTPPRHVVTVAGSSQSSSPDEPLTVTRTQQRPKRRCRILASDDEDEDTPKQSVPGLGLVPQASPLKTSARSSPRCQQASLALTRPSASLSSPAPLSHLLQQPLQNVTNLQPPGPASHQPSASKSRPQSTTKAAGHPSPLRAVVSESAQHRPVAAKPGILELSALLNAPIPHAVASGPSPGEGEGTGVGSILVDGARPIHDIYKGPKDISSISNISPPREKSNDSEDEQPACYRRSVRLPRSRRRIILDEEEGEDKEGSKRFAGRTGSSVVSDATRPKGGVDASSCFDNGGSITATVNSNHAPDPVDATWPLDEQRRDDGSLPHGDMQTGDRPMLVLDAVSVVNVAASVLVLDGARSDSCSDSAASVGSCGAGAGLPVFSEQQQQQGAFETAPSCSPSSQQQKESDTAPSWPMSSSQQRQQEQQQEQQHGRLLAETDEEGTESFVSADEGLEASHDPGAVGELAVPRLVPLGGRDAALESALSKLVESLTLNDAGEQEALGRLGTQILPAGDVCGSGCVVAGAVAGAASITTAAVDEAPAATSAVQAGAVQHHAGVLLDTCIGAEVERVTASGELQTPDGGLLMVTDCRMGSDAKEVGPDQGTVLAGAGEEGMVLSGRVSQQQEIGLRMEEAVQVQGTVVALPQPQITSAADRGRLVHLAHVPRRRQGRDGRDIAGEAAAATADTNTSAGGPSSDGLMYDLFGELLLASQLRGLSLDAAAQLPSEASSDGPVDDGDGEDDDVFLSGADAAEDDVAVADAVTPRELSLHPSTLPHELLDLTLLASSDTSQETDEEEGKAGAGAVQPCALSPGGSFPDAFPPHGGASGGGGSWGSACEGSPATSPRDETGQVDQMQPGGDDVSRQTSDQLEVGNGAGTGWAGGNTAEGFQRAGDVLGGGASGAGGWVVVAAGGQEGGGGVYTPISASSGAVIGAAVDGLSGLWVGRHGGHGEESGGRESRGDVGVSRRGGNDGGDDDDDSDGDDVILRTHRRRRPPTTSRRRAVVLESDSESSDSSPATPVAGAVGIPVGWPLLLPPPPPALQPFTRIAIVLSSPSVDSLDRDAADRGDHGDDDGNDNGDNGEQRTPSGVWAAPSTLVPGDTSTVIAGTATAAITTTISAAGDGAGHNGRASGSMRPSTRKPRTVPATPLSKILAARDRWVSGQSTIDGLDPTGRGDESRRGHDDNTTDDDNDEEEEVDEKTESDRDSDSGSGSDGRDDSEYNPEESVDSDSVEQENDENTEWIGTPAARRPPPPPPAGGGRNLFATPSLLPLPKPLLSTPVVGGPATTGGPPRRPPAGGGGTLGRGGAERGGGGRELEEGAGAMGPARRRPLATVQEKVAAAQKRTFLATRQQSAQEMYHSWNAAVFDGQLPPDLPIVWNSRLTSTAGQVVAKPVPRGSNIHIPAKLELSCRIVDTLAKLRNTLSHEMCHVAAWHIDHEYGKPHGPAWDGWRRHFQSIDPSLSISVTHSYITSYAHRWRCSAPDCGKEVGRQRRTINVQMHVCGSCRAPIVYLGRFDAKGRLRTAPPEAGAAGPGAGGSAGGGSGGGVGGGESHGGMSTAKKPLNEYAQFFKENYSAVKTSMPPRTPSTVIFKQMGQLYQQEKARIAATAGAAAVGGSPSAANRTLAPASPRYNGGCKGDSEGQQAPAGGLANWAVSGAPVVGLPQRVEGGKVDEEEKGREVGEALVPRMISLSLKEGGEVDV